MKHEPMLPKMKPLSVEATLTDALIVATSRGASASAPGAPQDAGRPKWPAPVLGFVACRPCDLLLARRAQCRTAERSRAPRRTPGPRNWLAAWSVMSRTLEQNSDLLRCNIEDIMKSETFGNKTLYGITELIYKHKSEMQV